MSVEEIKKLTQYEIIELISIGNVDALEQAVWDRRIEVPQDLFNFKAGASTAERDSALHVAAKFGQPKVMQYLLTGLRWEVDKAAAEGEEPQKEIRTWALDAGVKNINGETAIDIVKGNANFVNKSSKDGRLRRIAKATANVVADVASVAGAVVTIAPLTKSYSPAEKKMIEMLDSAALPPGPLRDSNMRSIKEAFIPDDMLPKKSENTSVAWGNRNRYTGSKDEAGNVRDSAALHMQVLEEVSAERAAKNKARDGREDAKRHFLFKAEEGTLSEKDIQEYMTKGGRIDAATDRQEKNGVVKVSKNALHLAIEGGHANIVEMLLKGDKAGTENIINFDSQAGESLAKLKSNPKNSKNYQKIADLLKDPETIVAQAKATPLRSVSRGISAGG